MSVPAGWYPQPDGQQRYWDGEQWTENLAPGAPPVTNTSVGLVQRDAGTPTIPDSTRKSRLAQAVQQEVVSGGRIEAQGEFNAVIRFGKPVNHVLHLILTLITFGMWGLVWIVMVILGSTSNYAVTLNVDEYGNMLRQRI